MKLLAEIVAPQKVIEYYRSIMDVNTDDTFADISSSEDDSY